MICAFGFHSGDVLELHSLLRWIHKLGDCKNHTALLVADSGTPWNDVHYAYQLATVCFSEVRLITNDKPTSGWISGSNSLWLAAAKFCAKPWLWMETDAVPLRPAWLDSIQDEYEQCGSPFMGHVYDCDQTGLPKKLLSGIAVYPQTAHKFLSDFVKPDKAFDVCIAERVIPVAAHTNLIQHFWGQPGLPPVFYGTKQEGAPINAFTLKNLNPEAVIFHREKSGSLIRLLDLKLFPNNSSQLVVLFPFCDKDAEMAIKNMEWIAELNSYDHDLILSYETGTHVPYVKRMRSLGGKCFKNVFETRYSPPGPGQWGPNVAFRHAAFYIDQQIKKPWLWLEYDMIPLKPEWLETLQLEYTRCGMPFCGPLVHGPGHFNGTSIYPPNTPDYIPEALATQTGAWDTNMKDEMAMYAHDCGHLIGHFWGVVGGKLHQYLGNSPCFLNGQFVDQIPPSVVVAHRSKDGHLIDYLRKNKRAK